MIHRVLVVQTNFDTKALFYILLQGLLCEQKYIKPLIKKKAHGPLRSPESFAILGHLRNPTLLASQNTTVRAVGMYTLFGQKILTVFKILNTNKMGERI